MISKQSSPSMQEAGPPLIEDVTEAYRTAAAAEVTLHPVVSHPLVRELLSCYGRLRDERETLLSRQSGQRLLRDCGALSFALSHAPLPLNHSSYASLASQALLEQCRREFGAGATILRQSFDDLRNIREEILACCDAPYLDALALIAPSLEMGVALVIAKLSWAAALQEQFINSATERASTSQIPILAADAGDLTRFLSYKKLYIFGAIRSYPEYLYTASRTERIEWLLFDWMRREVRPELLLTTLEPRPPAAPPGEVERGVRPWWRVQVARETTRGRVDEKLQSEAEFEQLASAHNPSRGSSGMDVARDAASAGADSLTPAKILYVRTGAIVYVPHDEDVDCVEASNLRTQNTLSIVRKKGNAIDPGDFVIVYSRGSRRFIQTEADRYLGPRAHVLRAAQSEWKQALGRQLMERGGEAVSNWLKQHGGVHSGEHNLKYWVWEHFIRPQKRADFEAIFRLIDRSVDADRYWDMMGEIRAAHVAAGRKAHARLEQLVAQLNVRQVFAEGYANLSTDPQSGKLTLVQVEVVAPESRDVPEGQLLRLLE